MWKKTKEDHYMNECAFEKTSDPSLQGIKPDDWAAQSLMFCPVVCVFFFFFVGAWEQQNGWKTSSKIESEAKHVIKSLKKNKALILWKAA